MDLAAPRGRSLVEWLRLAFGLREQVSRADYARVGFTLIVLKYGLDALFVWAATGELWTPFDYLVPLLGLRDRKLHGAPPGFSLGMALWTLPFLWIGISMTIRRAADAGLTPWYGMLFFVPLLNYVVMLHLAFAAERDDDDGWFEREPQPAVDDRFRSALLGMALSVLLSLVMLFFSVYVIGSYPTALFVGNPFVAASLCAFVYNYRGPRTFRSTLQVTVISLMMIMGALTLFALEGAVFVLMAAPLALLVAFLGAAVGRAIAISTRHTPLGSGIGVVVLPIVALLEQQPGPQPSFEVATVIEVDAPPDEVWPHVVAVSELPPPQRLLFELGVAYPQRARIEGTGVGAIRHCEFSTGAFVEPITAWEPPQRLAFDVIRQPPPLSEWSPYNEIHPPHLDGYFRTTRGEFRLIALPGNRTRLEGRTWYELDIHPRPYWQLYADGIVHMIHERVLEHIARTATTR